MFRIRKIVLSVGFLISSSVSHSFIGGHNVTETFPATLGIWNKMGGFVCTAVKVSETQLLTAAHCNAIGELNRGAFVKLKSGEAKFAGTVRKYTPHRSWGDKYIPMKNRGDLDHAIDLAIVTLDRPLPFQSAKISLNPVKVGDSIVVGGLGKTGNSPKGGPLKVSRKLVLEDLPTVFVYGVEDFDSESYSMGADGDSGGPAYRLNVRTNSMDVVGINRARDDDKHMIISDKTGEIVGFVRNKPVYFIQYLVRAAGEDFFKVEEFLKLNLPSESFSF